MYTGLCALCGGEGPLKTEHRLTDGRRTVRWICTTTWRSPNGDYEGCGRVALSSAELEQEVLRIEAADPSSVRRSTAAEEETERAARYPARGRGRPRRYQPITRYGVARRDAVERLGARLGRSPGSEEIRHELDLTNGTFYRYEAELRAAEVMSALRDPVHAVAASTDDGGGNAGGGTIAVTDGECACLKVVCDQPSHGPLGVAHE